MTRWCSAVPSCYAGVDDRGVISGSGNGTMMATWLPPSPSFLPSLPISRSWRVVGETTSGARVDRGRLGHRLRAFIAQARPWWVANDGWRGRGYVEGEYGLLARVWGSARHHGWLGAPYFESSVVEARTVVSGGRGSAVTLCTLRRWLGEARRTGAIGVACIHALERSG